LKEELKEAESCTLVLGSTGGRPLRWRFEDKADDNKHPRFVVSA